MIALAKMEFAIVIAVYIALSRKAVIANLHVNADLILLVVVHQVNKLKKRLLC